MDASFQTFASRDLMGFYRELLGAASPSTPVALLPPSRADREAWNRGVPLLRLPVVRVDATAFKEVLAKVVRVCTSHFPAIAAEPEFEKALQELTRPEKLEALIAALLSGGEVKVLDEPNLAVKAGQACAWVLGQAFKVALRGLWPQVVGWWDPGEWQRGYCPVCGGNPSMGLLDGDGRYHLYCGLCEAQWPSTGVCPFCGQDGWERVPVPEADGEEACALYACRRCRGYLKTVEERRGAVVDLFWEDLNT
ncbi:MAG: formate dehydrogenase accessory protein FdhE, partial [Moorellales bacterium]